MVWCAEWPFLYTIYYENSQLITMIGRYCQYTKAYNFIPGNYIHSCLLGYPYDKTKVPQSEKQWAIASFAFLWGGEVIILYPVAYCDCHVTKAIHFKPDKYRLLFSASSYSPTIKLKYPKVENNRPLQLLLSSVAAK